MQYIVSFFFFFFFCLIFIVVTTVKFFSFVSPKYSGGHDLERRGELGSFSLSHLWAYIFPYSCSYLPITGLPTTTQFLSFPGWWQNKTNKKQWKRTNQNVSSREMWTAMGDKTWTTFRAFCAVSWSLPAESLNSIRL